MSRQKTPPLTNEELRLAYHAVGSCIVVSRVADFAFTEALTNKRAYTAYTKKLDELTKLQQRLIDQMTPEKTRKKR